MYLLHRLVVNVVKRISIYITTWAFVLPSIRNLSLMSKKRVSREATLDNLRYKTQKKIPITLEELTGPLRNKHGFT